MRFQSPEEARLNAGLDIKQLAERSTVSPQSIGRIERGETKNLQALTLEKIGSALSLALKDRGIEFSVSAFIAMCIERRNKKLDAGGFNSSPRPSRRKAS